MDTASAIFRYCMLKLLHVKFSDLCCDNAVLQVLGLGQKKHLVEGKMCWLTQYGQHEHVCKWSSFINIRYSAASFPDISSKLVSSVVFYIAGKLSQWFLTWQTSNMTSIASKANMMNEIHANLKFAWYDEMYNVNLLFW